MVEDAEDSLDFAEPETDGVSIHAHPFLNSFSPLRRYMCLSVSTATSLARSGGVTCR